MPNEQGASGSRVRWLNRGVAQAEERAEQETGELDGIVEVLGALAPVGPANGS